MQEAPSSLSLTAFHGFACLELITVWTSLASTDQSARCPYSIETWVLLFRCNDHDKDHSSNQLFAHRSLTRPEGQSPWASASAITQYVVQGVPAQARATWNEVCPKLLQGMVLRFAILSLNCIWKSRAFCRCIATKMQTPSTNRPDSTEDGGGSSESAS